MAFTGFTFDFTNSQPFGLIARLATGYKAITIASIDDRADGKGHDLEYTVQGPLATEKGSGLRIYMGNPAHPDVTEGAAKAGAGMWLAAFQSCGHDLSKFKRKLEITSELVKKALVGRQAYIYYKEPEGDSKYPDVKFVTKANYDASQADGAVDPAAGSVLSTPPAPKAPAAAKAAPVKAAKAAPAPVEPAADDDDMAALGLDS